MDLQQLTTFRTIATLGSFSQAANLMGYAQSTVSEQIKNLENELNTRLFERAGSKQVILTPAGKTLLSYAQKISNLEEEIRSEVHKPAEPQGSFSVRIPETVSIYYLPALLKRFHQCFPKINLDFMNCVYFDLQDELRAGSVDLGFLIIDEFQAQDLACEKLGTVPLWMVTSASSPLATGFAPELIQLKGEPLIAPANDCSYMQLLERVLLEQKVKLSMVWHFNSIAAIKQVVINGTGFCVLPAIAVEKEVAAGELVVLPWQEGASITANLLMIWQKNKWLPPVLQTFMEMVHEISPVETYASCAPRVPIHTTRSAAEM